MILLEHGPGMKPAAFRAARRLVTAHAAADVLPALAELDTARAEGHWVAGWMAYEAGFALEPKLAHLMPDGPGRFWCSVSLMGRRMPPPI